MKEIKLEILGLSTNQAQSGSFALVLGEVGGVHKLPIIIGMFEAQAIAIEIEKIKPNRPMTHDLFKSIADAFDYKVEKVLINDLREGTFFARLYINNGVFTSEIDARPSDAIAIAVRFGAPIFTTDEILNEAGITLAEFDQATENNPDSPIEIQKKPEGKKTDSNVAGSSQYSNLSIEKIKSMLDDALANEDYELAARLRDELNKKSS